MADDGVCDGCGAMLPGPDTEGLALCMSCGRVNRSKTAQAASEGPSITTNIGGADDAEQEPAAGTRATEPPVPGAWTSASGKSSTGRTGRTARSVGCIVGVLALVVGITAAAYGIFKAASSPSGPLAPSRSTDRLYPAAGTTLLLPGEGRSTAAAMVVTDNGDDGARKVARVEMGPSESEHAGGLVWLSGALAGGSAAASMATDGEVLYAALGDQLTVLDLATGDERWRAALSDDVTVGCRTCFVVVGDVLVVRTGDAYLTAFVAGSSEPRWTRRLRAVSARPSVVGESLLVVDDPAEPGGPTVAERVDPASGRTVGTAHPLCAESAEPYLPFEVELDPDTEIRAVPGSGDAVAVFGRGCAARWEVETGTVRWAVPVSIPLGGDEVLVDDAVLVASDDATMTRLDLASGAAQSFEAVPDASSAPAGIVGDTLIGLTTSTRGRARGGLASWSLASGQQLMSRPLPDGAEPVSDGPFGSYDALFDGSPRAVVVPGPKIKVFVFDGADRTVTTQEVDPVTGEESSSAPRDLLSRYSASGTPSLAVEAITDDALLVSIDGLFQRIPFDPTADIERWPPA